MQTLASQLSSTLILVSPGLNVANQLIGSDSSFDFFPNHKLAHNLMLFRSLDLELILKKSPLLIQEMINCISQLFYYHKADAGECL